MKKFILIIAILFLRVDLNAATPLFSAIPQEEVIDSSHTPHSIIDDDGVSNAFNTMSLESSPPHDLSGQVTSTLMVLAYDIEEKTEEKKEPADLQEENTLFGLYKKLEAIEQEISQTRVKKIQTPHGTFREMNSSLGLLFDKRIRALFNIAKLDTAINEKCPIVVSASEQGRRCYMQDVLFQQENATVAAENVKLFGVFDGHGDCGGEIASWAVQPTLNYFATSDSLEYALHSWTGYLDEELKNHNLEWYKKSGSTASLCAIKGSCLHYSNAGDSRMILSYCDGAIEQLSADHRPETVPEAFRIWRLGGKITKNRVSGNLAVSRGIGDGDDLLVVNDKKLISSTPHVGKVFIQDDADFVVIASDGVWDFMSNQQVCEFIRAERVKMFQFFNVSKMTHAIARVLLYKLMYKLIFGSGQSSDNIAITLIFSPSGTSGNFNRHGNAGGCCAVM